MTRCARVVIVISVLAIFAGISALYAIWEENGVLICGADGDQYVITTTEAWDDGIVIAWRDERSGEGDYDIYATKLDPEGNVLWTPDGVPICTEANSQLNPMAVTDGAGGAIIAWEDDRGPGLAIFAQRVDIDGTVLWTADGDSIFTEIIGLGSMMMISDREGGAIVLWADSRSGTYDVIGQRINGNGVRQWAAAGIMITDLTGNQFPEDIIESGPGEYIVSFVDNRSGNNDIYAQKFDNSGTLLWPSAARPVCTDAAAQNGGVLVSDGTGGAVIAWTDDRDAGDEVYVQRINDTGSTVWATDGISVAGGSSVLGPLSITTDGEGGAIVGYTAGVISPELDIHALVQRIDAFGNMQWWPGGVTVSTGMWPTYSEALCSDGEGGTIVSIYDLRDMSESHIYTQRIDHDGLHRWAPGGTPIYTSTEGEADMSLIVSDGGGGAYLVWADDRNTYFDIFASRVNGYGGIGGLHDPPTISSVSDVPNDQGGKIMLRWMASPADTFPNALIDSYSAWRLLPDAGAAAMPALKSADIVISAESVGETVKYMPTAAGDAWELIGYVPARQAEEYALMVESLFDSMGTDPGWQYFVVTAHMEESIIFFDSPVDSGYSVDNLSPAQPVAFGGIQSLAPPGLSVYWDAGTESDLGHYEVYKSPAEDFVPGPGNLVGSAADTELLDTGWIPGDEDFFKLVAVDVHGNKGPAALLRPENIYVGTLLQSFSASWTDSWIEIAWTLSETGDKMVFHVLRAERSGGRFEEIEGPHLDRDGLSFVLEDHDCEPGVTYLYRIEVEEKGGRRILFETEGIEAPTLPLTLFQNVPNPFNPSTSIAFYLPERSHVRIDVYDVAGRLVTTLADETRPGGQNTVEWNGSDAAGRTAASGVYFYRLVTGKFKQTKKMILLR